MSVEDFRKIMLTKSKSNPTNSEWEEVYRLVEKAQTKKRNFTYPPIGRKEIQTISASSIADAKEGQIISPQRFKPFTTISESQENSLGLAITSPVLLLKEGKRSVTLTLACQKNTLNRDVLTKSISKVQPFEIYLSSEEGWIESNSQSTTFEVGDFILEKPLKSYTRDELFLICTALGQDKFNQNPVNQYLLFEDGNIYQISAFENEGKVKLRSAGNVPEYGTFKKYPNLSLMGSPTKITELILSKDKQEITAGSDKFTADDKNKFIVWSDGSIYRIERVNDARKVEVQRWGYLPNLKDGNVKKYDRIAFNNPSPISQLAITGIWLDSEAEEKRLYSHDAGKLMVWDNGTVLKIKEYISEHEANIEIIGRVPTDEVNTNTINQYRPTAIYLNSLQFRLTLDETFPAIMPLKLDESSVVIDTPYPVVKIVLKNTVKATGEEKINYYEQFKSIRLEKVRIQVKAENVQDVQLRNDSSVLNPQSPFQPFGNSPKIGSGFYIANREVSRKKLDSLTLHIEWMGLPQNFATHYEAYSSTEVITPAITNDSFKASLKLFNNRSSSKIEIAKPLFGQENNKLKDTTNLTYENFDISSYSLDPTMVELGTDNPFDERRYFKLELESPDFGQDIYPTVLNKIALAKDEDEGKNAQGQNIKIKSLTVYPPYTPEVKALSLDYTSSVEINLRDQHPSNRILQLHPFGYAGIPDGDFLLPQYDYQGGLFIGIRNLHPPQDLSILFQMVAGSGNAELIKPEIHWQYLSQNGWQSFKPVEILSDSTNGLVDSGIIRLSIPETASDRNSLLPTGLYWLRATVKENTTAIPDILDIKTQAVSATFVNQGNAPEHLSKPLAANSIQELTDRDPAIQAVLQPYSSFKGKMKENSRAFYTRVSERLRHKQRALTTWDYERIVLEKFPAIYKVKCLSQADRSNHSGSANVTVVVVPDISNTAPFFPLEPKAPLYLLKEIEEYLTAHTSLFVNITVKNPSYEQIKYRIAVRFKKGYEQGYYLKQLNEDIKHFLSPWAYEEQADIPFGSSTHSSTLIHFIEKRAYIDYVANIKLIEHIHMNEGKANETVTDNYQVNKNNLAQVRHADAILVSAPDHIIDLIATERYEEEAFEGIGYMIIGIDFEIS